MSTVNLNPYLQGSYWRQALTEALSGSIHDWIFIFKACLAVMASGWIAFRLELDAPGTAMLTCAIVINPKSGLVLAKSFYRIIGTLIGSLVAVCLVASFPQQRELLLGGISLWLGLCAGGAALLRNFKSYGFVLAGYTTAIVIIPVVDNPLGIFDSAVMRTITVLLGILVTAVVTDAILPQGLSKILRNSIFKQFTGFFTFVQNSLPNNLKRLDLEQAHFHFGRQAVEIENLLSSAVFEDTHIRAASPHIRQLNQRLMRVSSTYCMLLILMDRLQRANTEVHGAVAQLFTSVSWISSQVDLAAAPVIRANTPLFLLKSTRIQLKARAVQLRKRLNQGSQQLEFDAGAELIMRFVDDLETYTNAYTGFINPNNSPIPLNPEETTFIHGDDWLGAVLAAALSTGAILVGSLFWILTAWPSGGGMVVIAGVLCALMASSVPNLKKALGLLWIAWIIGNLLAFLCTFLVLSHMDGFTLLTAGMIPFLIPIFYLYTRPSLASLGAFIALSFLLLVEPAFTQNFDVPQYINQAIALLLGLGLVNVAFILFTNASESDFFYRRLIYKLRSEVVRACYKPLQNAHYRLESATHDRCRQAILYTGENTRAAQHFLAWALSVHEVGRIIIELRTNQQQISKYLQQRLNRVITAIATLYETPKSRYLLHAQRIVASTLRMANSAHVSNIAQYLYLLHLALTDQDSVLASYLPKHTSKAAKEITHAG
ncbi:fusaric acid resistance protein [Candidatus Nitrosoglobus terrae]|uniref:Fusaric acid resistance protein n=1 Tax=Candidatus Nitrosoglobus terrae TaxID=1630141 RepID=A0A1Q2SN01_9GAMM|nr:FUSC family protein [Candidatus Nitrosoglobus terrae]BAW80514.1 fusaric acid resistance protein [Candidatus Nitrosoglobus terrae]